MKDSRTRIEEVKIVNMKNLQRVKRPVKRNVELTVALLMESGRHCCLPPSSESRWAEWDWGLVLDFMIINAVVCR